MSKRRYYNITLNNEPFILDIKDTVDDMSEQLSMLYRYHNIWQAYDRPSQYKIAIWEDWGRWFNSNNGVCWIESRNCWQFTISGYVYDENGQKYYCYITKSYNRCWKVGV